METESETFYVNTLVGLQEPSSPTVLIVIPTLEKRQEPSITISREKTITFPLFTTLGNDTSVVHPILPIPKH